MIADYFKAAGWRVMHIVGVAEPAEHPYTSVETIVYGRLTY